jgi:hypothetical protein
MYIYINVYVYARIFIYINLFMFHYYLIGPAAPGGTVPAMVPLTSKVSMFIFVCIWMYICMYVYGWIYVYVYMYVYDIYEYICIFIDYPAYGTINP